MVGLGETYFAAFYLAVGISEFGVGLLATVPYLLGSALQLLTPWGVRKVKSYRVWTICTAAMQGLSLLALAVLALIGQVNFTTLLVFATIYWASGLATGPAWNTWIEFVVPKKIRATYFSVRMRICQLCLLASIAASGFLLRAFDVESQRMFVFIGLFAVAGVLRLMSSRALSTQIEHRSWLRSHYEAAKQTGDGELVNLIRQTVPFFAAMQFAVYISGPYFVPFMLKNLELGYLYYMILILAGYMGRVLAMPYAAWAVKRMGTTRLMLRGAIGIIPMSTLWIFHQSYLGLLAIQLASGAAWGCYELGMSLSFIEKIPGHHRMRVLSLFNTFNGLAMVGGSICGGLLLQQLDKSTFAFMTVFTLSGVFRIAAMYWFPYQLLERRCAQVKPLPVPTVEIAVMTPALTAPAPMIYAPNIPARVPTPVPIVASFDAPVADSVQIS
jgi:MFS family permease